MTRRAISIIRLKRCFIYRPLAAILALLMLPMFSRFEGDAGMRTFQASAGTIGGSKQIIQNYCVGSSCYVADLGQLERDAVAGYLGLHNLPADDTNIIYDMAAPTSAMRFAGRLSISCRGSSTRRHRCG